MMKYYDKLTNNRKAFINQLYTLISNQFDSQDNILGNEKEIMEELENNSDYIQRIFIDAPWGMGKSYFGKSLEELIENKNDLLPDERKIKPIKINAWEVDYYSDPMKSLMAEILEVVSEKEKEEIQKYFESLVKIGAKKILKTIAKTLMSLLIGKNNCENILDVCNSIISELPESEDFFKDYKEYRETLLNFKRTLSQSKEYKVIIIDELDRCRPTYAVELLETVKHIFGVKNIIFIFLVNKSQLKSTVSTMYLQEDEYGEYFEKFFDIQFRLPDIDYSNFIELEYEKYKKIDSYNVKNRISNERDLYLESLFLDVFDSNYDYNFETTPNKDKIPSIRLFIKAFKKYKLLLKSLSNEEKKHYPVMVLLIIYFLEKEFLWEESDERRMIAFLKTFFLLKNLKNPYSICSPDELFENYRIKNEYTELSNFYWDFYKILFYKIGYDSETELTNGTKNKTFALITDSGIVNNRILDVSLNGQNFKVNDLNTCILYDGWNNATILNIDGKCLNLKLNLKYRIFGRNCTYYNIDVLYEWCKEKYDFIIRSDVEK